MRERERGGGERSDFRRREIGRNLVGTVRNRAVAFCTLYYIYKISLAISFA